MGAAAAATRAALVARVVAATGEAPASLCPLGLRGPRDARCRVFDAEPLVARLQRAGRGMRLCTELGGVSEFHAAARFALASCPPNAPAGLSELFIFTDGSAAPPACPDASAWLGWSAVCVGRCGTGCNFLGALFHGMAGSGDVVQQNPVGDSTMELAAVLWARVWVVISCPPCSACIATDSLFWFNVAEALWSVGGHAQVACLRPSMLLFASQITDVRFEHVRAHEGNPFNELADGLAKRAAGGVVAPLSDDVSRWLVCGGSVIWEWLRGLPLGTRGAYPPVCDGFFVFPEARSCVGPSSLVRHAAIDVVKDHCSTDVLACVRFSFSMFVFLVAVVPAIGSSRGGLR